MTRGNVVSALLMLLAWCVASSTQTAASYSRPEHRQRPTATLAPTMVPLLRIRSHPHFAPHMQQKRQIQQQQHQQAGPGPRQQPFQQGAGGPAGIPQLNIPVLGFRRRQQHANQRAGGGGSPQPFTPQFHRPQQQQPPPSFGGPAAGKNNRVPHFQQQQQQQQIRRQFGPPSPQQQQPAFGWPKPTPAAGDPAVPTFQPEPPQPPRRRQSEHNQQPYLRRQQQQQQHTTLKRADDAFPGGFLNFGADFTRNFPKLPGSFEANFGSSYHSPSSDDSYNEQTEPEVSSDYDETPAVETPNQEEPNTPDYDEPESDNQQQGPGFPGGSRFPGSQGHPNFQRPQHYAAGGNNYEEDAGPPSPPPYSRPSPAGGGGGNYEDEQSSDYGTSLAEEAEGEGEGDASTSNDAGGSGGETEVEGDGPQMGYSRPLYAARPTPTAATTYGSNDDGDHDGGNFRNKQRPQHKRPQGGFRRPQVSYAPSDSGGDDDDVMHEPPSKPYYHRRPNNPTSYAVADDEDDGPSNYPGRNPGRRPPPPLRQQYEDPDKDVDAGANDDDDDGGFRRPRPTRPSYYSEQDDDDGGNGGPGTSSEAGDARDNSGKNDDDNDGIPASVRPEPFFQPKNQQQQQQRPQFRGRPHGKLRNDEDDVNEDDNTGYRQNFDGQRKPNSLAYEDPSGASNDEDGEGDDYDRRSSSSEPVYANDKGSYPQSASIQPQKFNVNQRRAMNPMMMFKRPQVANSRMDGNTAAKPVEQQQQQQATDRMDSGSPQVEHRTNEESDEDDAAAARQAETAAPAAPKPQAFSSLPPAGGQKRDFRSQRARLEALRQKFRTRASQRMTAQSREASTGTGAAVGTGTGAAPEIDVQKIMETIGKDHKPYENVGGYIEDDPNSPRRIDKYESEAEFHSQLVDTKSSKDSRIRKLLRKRIQPPITPEEMNAQPV